MVPDYSELNDTCHNRNLFLKDWFTIDKYFDGYVENTANPDGTWFDCTVTKVKSSNAKIVKVSYIKSWREWKVTGLKKGKATLTVSFKGYKKAAKTKKFTVTVVDEGVFLDGIDSVNGEWKGLPGESLVLETHGWYEKYNADFDDENIKYEWEVSADDAAYGEIVADPSDNSKAVLTFKNGPGLDEKSMEVDVKVTASYERKDGTVFSASEVTGKPEVMYEYNRFVTTPELPENLDIGQSITAELGVKRCQFDPDGNIYNDIEGVTFEIDVDEPEGLSVERIGYTDQYVFTRNNEWENHVEIDCFWDEDDDYEGGFTTGRHFEEINTDLDRYEIRYAGYKDNICYVGPEGITPTIKVVDWETGYVLPTDEYTLEYYKVTWDEDGNETAVPCELPFTYDYDPNDRWSPNAGYARYKVIATTTEENEHGFEGTTDEENGYFEVYSDHGLSTAEVTVDPKFDEYKSESALFIDGIKYDLPFGTEVKASDFTVKLSEDEETEALRPDVDYEIRYANWLDEEIHFFEGFPEEAGEYACFIVSKGDYIGATYATMFFVGDKNTTTKIKATTSKTLKAKKLKKKAQTFKAFTITDLVGEKYFGKYGGSNKITVNPETGKITVKKGTKKGTYKATINVFISGNEQVAPIDELYTVTVKVK